MVDFNDELKEWFELFYEHFHDTVPLRQIPRRVENYELIDAIKKSIEANENLLPVIFGYGGRLDVRY